MEGKPEGMVFGSKQDTAYLNNNTMDNEQPSLERELIVKYFKPPSTNVQKWMTTSEIKVYIDMNSRQSLSLHKLGQQLKALGYIQQSRREEAGSVQLKNGKYAPATWKRTFLQFCSKM